MVGAPVAVLNALAFGTLPRTLRGCATELGAGLLWHPIQKDYIVLVRLFLEMLRVPLGSDVC